jgi:hypothetical protein
VEGLFSVKGKLLRNYICRYGCTTQSTVDLRKNYSFAQIRKDLKLHCRLPLQWDLSIVLDLALLEQHWLNLGHGPGREGSLCLTTGDVGEPKTTTD